MVYREHGMWEVLEVLRRVHRGEGRRATARATGRSRETVNRYVQVAATLGWRADDEEPGEELAARVAARLRPGPRGCSPGETELALLERKERIRSWLEPEGGERRGLTLKKVHTLLARSGVEVPYSSLHRFAVRELGFGRQIATVRMAEVAAGEVAEVDFGRLGFLYDSELEKRKLAWALVVTLVFSRHMYVHVTYRQQSADFIAGLDAAWGFLGGVTARVVIDNLKAAVVKANRYDPTLQRTFEEYARVRGFVIDPAPPNSPTGKPTVERSVPYVRENFFRGERFVSLGDVQENALRWCRVTAGMRIHGTTRKRPLEVFESMERSALRPFDGERFDVPRWLSVTVHPDCHVRVGHALYSVPYGLRGAKVTVRADSCLVRIYAAAGQLVKTHATASPGERRTDFADYPAEKTAYAMRDASFLIRRAREQGAGMGVFAEKLLSGTYPWAKLRQAQKLLRLVDKYGAARVEAACARAVMYDVINVFRVESMVLQALSAQPPAPSSAPVETALRFLREPRSFTHSPGGKE
jgi:transposase